MSDNDKTALIDAFSGTLGTIPGVEITSTSPDISQAPAAAPKRNKGGRPVGSKESREAKKEKQNRKIIELAQNNVPVRAIAQAVGMSKQSVQMRLTDFRKMLKTLERMPDWESRKADFFSAAQWQTLKYMMKPDKMEKASFNNLAYGLTQLHQATRLERQQTTANVGAVVKFCRDELPTDDNESK